MQIVISSPIHISNCYAIVYYDGHCITAWLLKTGKVPFINHNFLLPIPVHSPVCDVVVVPFEVSVECLVAAYVWDTTPGAFHGVQRGLIQHPSLLQAQLSLQLLQSPGGGHQGFEATAMQTVYVAKPLQVFLGVENTNNQCLVFFGVGGENVKLSKNK